MTNKCFIGFGALFFSHVAIAFTPTISYMNTNIETIVELVKNNKISCQQLTERYINRIKTFDLAHTKSKPPINSVITLNPLALSEARAVDIKLAKNKKLSLLCVPVVVKDNIDTVDTPTTSGSLSLLGSQPNTDAFIVKRLRRAGAIILGKGGMDEFASGTWGINSRLGRTGNPYNTNLLPGGSSSGPAAAVNAGFAVIGLGSDNSGSLRIPAAANGLYTIRGGTGTVSQTGIFPRGNLDGVAGVIAQNIEDVARVMDVIAIKDKNDPKTLPVERPHSYMELLSEKALQEMRIGVVTSYGDKKVDYENAAVKKYYQRALEVFKQQGATIVPNIRLTAFITDRSNNTAGEVQQINEYLHSFPSTREDFKGICQSGRTTQFGSEKQCLQHAKDNPKVMSKVYRLVLDNFQKNRQLITCIMQKNKLDALLLPISQTGVPTGGFDNEYYTIVSPNSGLPAVEFIIGYTSASHLPVGMQLVGGQYSEEKLLAMAYAFSQQVKRQAPKLMKPQSATVFSVAKFNDFKTVLGDDTYNKIIKPNGVKAVTGDRFMKLFIADYKSLRFKD